MPVSTRYDGLLDCIRNIYKDEGISGFYKGFGALVLQYAIYFLVLRMLRLLFEQLEDTMKKREQVRPPALPSDPTIYNRLHQQSSYYKPSYDS